MTGAALLCRMGLGQGIEEDTPKRSLALLLEKPPQWQPDDGHVDYCYWFFGGEALRHAAADQGKPWRDAMVSALVEGQRREEKLAGSWDPVGPWGEDGGRLYSTALAVLALQSLYPSSPE